MRSTAGDRHTYGTGGASRRRASSRWLGGEWSPWFLEKKEDAKASMADYGDAAGWEKQQMKTFTAWVNMYLQRSKDVTPVVNIVTDFSEGIRLIKLLDNILEVRLRCRALGRSGPASFCCVLGV